MTNSNPRGSPEFDNGAWALPVIAPNIPTSFGRRRDRKKKTAICLADYRFPLEAGGIETGFGSDDRPTSYALRHASRMANGASDGAVDARDWLPDPRLARLIEVWSMLSEATRDAIATLAGDDLNDLDDVPVATK